MLIKNLGRLFLYVVMLVTLFVSSSALVEEYAQAATCCAIGADCPGKQDICCDPGSLGALPCSANAPGYCRLNCN